MKTPLYASVLAWLYRNELPEIGLAEAANVFGSDTDTIATMAGALMGVVAQTRPETPVQDEEYIQTEASRMFRAGRREPVLSFEYPDLLSWIAPKAQSDAWISESKGERLAGIGSIQPFGPIYKKPKKGLDLVWQWAKLDFGQTVLVKRRAGQTSDWGHAEESRTPECA
ncbi:ADP-ribosylglycohydrolase family protein [Rhodoferax sp.]|uniref:ADP-ribosylglycohydrolase family protein n=1 Tax=Rhodoferax sp. TaxID=50421 RepID=UPI002ACD7AEC|nr:ADP-ribosylglycohydrolase family protein [Rhodoferax sp.]MDZ7921193.1 ADP-ribosylglycohydrolase family protein [Rhodoferax sp.]